MPKLKTHKSIAKRFRVSKGGKLVKKKAGQGHFNARESGNTTRMKRRYTVQDDTLARTVKSYLPTSNNV